MIWAAKSKQDLRQASRGAAFTLPIDADSRHAPPPTTRPHNAQLHARAYRTYAVRNPSLIPNSRQSLHAQNKAGESEASTRPQHLPPSTLHHHKHAHKKQHKHIHQQRHPSPVARTYFPQSNVIHSSTTNGVTHAHAQLHLVPIGLKGPNDSHKWRNRSGPRRFAGWRGMVCMSARVCGHLGSETAVPGGPFVAY
ncbi:uncharacterized protein EI97DRAFT_162735 [Westerdykella ornata]|uniref:Uncharacterized protein n=1 Tax=Westerdykella ornata TaxID=318751 RepID=A0A6A6JC14_WESOR|nr:uncharacterized protein EI97DRAFT_162735 [Westerdykella ornata]KAF2273176.1 hypothetical protein EI97DRAFT_162735 [Westerdykella ornata]